MEPIKGEWFLADNQETKIPGILTIDEINSTISLQLFSEKRIIQDFKHKLLIGHSIKSNITILNCVPTNEEPISKNLTLSKFSPHFVFIGCQFNAEDDIKLKKIKIEFNYFDQWLATDNETLFQIDIEDDGSFSTKYKSKKDIIVELNEQCILSFERDCSITGGHETPLRTDINYYANFSFKQHVPFVDFLNLIVKLQNLLMLFIGKPLSVKSRIGYSEKAIELKESHNSDLENYPIEIFNRNSIEDQNKTDYVHANEMLICFKNFKTTEIVKFIQNWFSEYDKFEPVYDIFFHAIKPFWQSGGFLMSNVNYNNAFLNIVQSLESYHRIKYGISNINTEFNITKNRIKQAATCLSREDKAWIDKNAKPRGKKEVYLIERIEELIKNKNIFDYLFDNENDIAKNLVKWRDSLTHINHSRSTDVQVRNWFYKAQIILIVNIFIDLGLEEEQIKKIISSSRLFYK